jgi:hypothetical protein
MRVGRSILILGAAALLVAAAGCGSDSSGETSTPVQATAPVPTVTSPLPTTTATASTATGGGKKKPQTATTTTSAPAGACTIPDAYTDFKYTGLPCTSAVAVATAWDQDGKDCNTVDNPNVDEGYHRTCSVEGFTCNTRRDVHSDGRFVTCTQGGQIVRFTWLPA